MNTDNSMQTSEDTLRSYLKEEIERIRERLASLKGGLKVDDYDTLDAELKERSERLDTLTDDDETQLFILRREIGLLSENLESLAVKQSWWTRLPTYARILVFIVPVILYLTILSLIQIFNKGQVYDYPATQTAIASQTFAATQSASTIQPTLSGPAVTPTATSTSAP